MQTFLYEATVGADQIDGLGHLNNAAYLAIFEAGRWAVLTDPNAWNAVTEAGVAPVILSVKLDFHREVLTGEPIRVETTFRPVSPRRFVTWQKMYGADGTLRATAEFQSGFLDIQTRRMTTPTPAVLAALGADASEIPEAPVIQGVGGVFLNATNVDTLADWYAEHLGLTLERWGRSRGIELPSVDRVPSARITTTTFALFPTDTPLPPDRTGRVNFRVADLDGLAARLQAAGVRVEEGPTDYGRFLWVWDLEGNKVELWEPPRAKA